MRYYVWFSQIRSHLDLRGVVYRCDSGCDSSGTQAEAS